MEYIIFFLQMLFRVVTMIVAPIILVIPTLYATYKDLNKLPWGLDSIFGCEEDGWNGNGIDPSFPRKYNKPNEWGKLFYDESYKPTGTQGWWPDYKKLDWDKLSFWKKWWLGYQWCALRNVCWNLRLNDWFGESIHFKDIHIQTFQWEKDNKKPAKVEWINKNGNKRFYRRKYIFGKLVEYGWEFHPWIFEKDFTTTYDVIRAKGYYNVKPEWAVQYKDRSIPSVRLRG